MAAGEILSDEDMDELMAVIDGDGDGIEQEELERTAQVRQMPSWPRRWANSSPLSLYFHKNAWANSHLVGQPDAFRATESGEGGADG